MRVQVVYPGFGSLWLEKAEWSEESVEGEVWDASEVGSPYLPDDFHGQSTWMNFPQTAVVRVQANG